MLSTSPVFDNVRCRVVRREENVLDDANAIVVAAHWPFILFIRANRHWLTMITL